MSQGPLCPNLTKKVQKEVSQIANRNLSSVILLGGLSVNLNHLKSQTGLDMSYTFLQIYVSKFKIPMLQKFANFFNIWAIST